MSDKFASIEPNHPLVCGIASAHNAIRLQEGNSKWSGVQNRLVLRVDPGTLGGARRYLSLELMSCLSQ
jgi:hypothetical protein